MENMPRVQQLINLYQSLKGMRANFESYWQSLHDYFYIEAGDINKSYYPGTELNATALFDSTTLESADVLASGFMNYLTPPSSSWFKLSSRNQKYRENKRITTFWEEVADEVNYTLNRSNFYDQQHSNYKSSGVYGTSVVLEEEDDQDDVRFYNIPIKNICLIEDSRGRVSGYFIEFEYTAQQAAEKWGRESLSREMQEELNPDNPKQNKHLFLLYIAKRSVRDVRKSDKRNKPIEASWIDFSGKIFVDEGGYEEMPAFTHRFEKRSFIPWGFSPAMKALPFARLLNAIAKTNLRAMMKQTDPALALPDNAFLMPLNANPRAVNYYNKAKMEGGRDDIFEFGNKGDINAGMAAIDYYTRKVQSLMYYDVFLAFEGLTKQMNNPEVMERINEKMTLLGPAVGRYISDVTNPIIVRTIGILSRKGRLPEPPDELVNDPGYEIDSISQLAQAQKRSELNALVSGLSLARSVAEYKPDVLDKISGDRTVDKIWSIVGAPTSVFNDDEEIEAIRDERGKAALAEQKMQLANMGADVVKKGASADKDIAMANAVSE